MAEDLSVLCAHPSCRIVGTDSRGNYMDAVEPRMRYELVIVDGHLNGISADREFVLPPVIPSWSVIVVDH